VPTSSIVFSKYLSNAFVETGSLVGGGIDAALEAGFKSVYSIELSDKYYNICLDKYRGKDNVHIIKGDSGLLLYGVIKDIDSKITFWLDGHHSGGDTAWGIANSPIMYELDLIKKHHIKDHIILVDDMRGFNDADIRAKILEINKNYRFYYENGYCPNDVLVAKV
jgi:hypothetical protein